MIIVKIKIPKTLNYLQTVKIHSSTTLTMRTSE